MLGFMANNDANSGKLGLHGLSSLIFTVPAMENGEKSKSECPLLESHFWYIYDIYLKVCVSIIICHEGPQKTVNFSMFLTVLVIGKSYYNIT